MFSHDPIKNASMTQMMEQELDRAAERVALGMLQTIVTFGLKTATKAPGIKDFLAEKKVSPQLAGDFISLLMEGDVGYGITKMFLTQSFGAEGAKNYIAKLTAKVKANPEHYCEVSKFMSEKFGPRKDFNMTDFLEAL